MLYVRVYDKERIKNLEKKIAVNVLICNRNTLSYALNCGIRVTQ